MDLAPGEMSWEDDWGYTRFFVGQADGGVFSTFEKDQAEAIAELEKRKAEAA